MNEHHPKFYLEDLKKRERFNFYDFIMPKFDQYVLDLDQKPEPLATVSWALLWLEAQSEFYGPSQFNFAIPILIQFYRGAPDLLIHFADQQMKHHEELRREVIEHKGKEHYRLFSTFWKNVSIQAESYCKMFPQK